MSSLGLFIAFEGGEGTGKSTQAKLLAERINAVLTREPGGTELGERVRALLLDPELDIIGDRSEALLMAAARAQHVEQIIDPQLREGRHVVTDRYIGSSLVYQGIGRGLGVEEVRQISEWATGSLWPDITFLIDVPFEVAEQRRLGQAPDRLEAQGREFHQQVMDGYRQLASALGWVVVDGSPTPEAVAELVHEKVAAKLGR